MSARESVIVDGKDVTVLRGGKGSPVLYLHGIAGDIHSSFAGPEWTPFLSGLASSHMVAAPALPGYNGSGGLDSMHSVEDYTFHLLDLVDSLGLREPGVVGSSIGGWIAAEFALRHPDRVGRLALLDPLGLHVQGSPPASFFRAVAPRGIGGFGEARQLLFADSSSAAALEALPDGMGQEQQLLWFGGLAGAARLGWRAPQFQSRSLAGRLRRITAPTLVLRGEMDRLVTPAHLSAWSAGIPRCSTLTIEGAGHCVTLERPDDVLAAVTSHLSEGSR